MVAITTACGCAPGSVRHARRRARGSRSGDPQGPPGPDSSRLAPSGVHGTASTGTLNHPRSPAMSADRSAIYRGLRDRSGLDARSLV